MTFLLASLLTLAMLGCGGPVPSRSVVAPGDPPGLPSSTEFPARQVPEELTASRAWPLGPLRRQLSARAAVAGNATVNLSPGWNSVAFQGGQVNSLRTSGDILGFASWDGANYQLAPFTAAEVNSGRGSRRGMWVFSQGPAAFTYTASDDSWSRSLALQGGWNLVSFADPGPIGNLTTKVDGQPAPLTSVLLTAFFRINPDNHYTTIDVTSGAALDGSRPHWIFAASNLTLHWTSPGPAPSPAGSPQPDPSPSPTGGGGGGGGGGGVTPPAPPAPTPVGTLRFVLSSFPSTSWSSPMAADSALAVQVELLDPAGQRLTTASASLSLTLDSAVPFGAALTGSTPQATASGVASFNGLGLNKIGSYRLRASAPNFADAVSPELIVGPGTPSRLSFVNYPRVGTVEEVLTPILVQLEDAKGNALDPGTTNYTVTLGLTGGPGPATVHDGSSSGLPPYPPSTTALTGSRVAFYDARISEAGTYRLTASTPGLTAAVMNAELLVDTAPDFTGPVEEIPSSLVFGSPFPALPAPAGAALTPLTVEVRNGNGDLIPSAGGVVQLEACSCNPAPGSIPEDPTTVGPSSGPRTTMLTAPVVNGVATFSVANGNAVSIIRAGEWTLHAVYSKGSLYTAQQTVQINPGPTVAFNFQGQPGPGPTPLNPLDSQANATVTGQSGPHPSPNPVIVEARDAFGNRSLQETRSISLAFSSAGPALQGQTSATPPGPLAPEAGLASFLDVVFPTGRLGVQTLTASLGAVNGTSSPFTILLEPVSLHGNGEIGPEPIWCQGPNAVSADGRYVVFERAILDALGTPQGYHIYRRDRQTGQTLRLNPGADNTFNFMPAISPNGQYVVFTSNAAYGGVTVPTSARSGSPALQIYCWQDSGLSLVSHARGNSTQGCNEDCVQADVNDSGVVAYDSLATDLVPGHRGSFQVYSAAAPGFTPSLVSESAPGVAMDNSSFALPASPSISNSGQVVFLALASDLPGYNPSGGLGIGLYRRTLGQAVQSGGLMLVNQQVSGPDVARGFSQFPHISDDGRYVAYAVQSFTGDLPSDDSTRTQVYRRDCNGPPGAVIQVSEGAGSRSAFGMGSGFPSISADGRFVAFTSTEGLARQSAPGGTLVYRRDCSLNTTALVSRSLSGPLETTLFSTWPSLASLNPTLCAFFTDQEAGYLAPVGQVYMTWTP